jgi:hypothetical protein
VGQAKPGSPLIAETRRAKISAADGQLASPLTGRVKSMADERQVATLMAMFRQNGGISVCVM